MSKIKDSNASVDTLTILPAKWDEWQVSQELLSELSYTFSLIPRLKKQMIVLSIEQAFMAMRLFLHKRYLPENSHLSLENIWQDMESHLNESLGSSELWGQWLESVRDCLETV